MNIKELQKEKLLIRVSNPIKASVIEMIIDMAQKIAKAENREVTDEDIITSVKRNVKTTVSAIDLIKSKHGDATKWEQELKYMMDFMPPMYSANETIIEVNRYLNTLPKEYCCKRNMGKIMAELKKNPSYDLSAVTMFLREALK